ncbi:N4-gp56 family major capsid protein [Lacticaseibacillus mingshuiensis]|uniref:N4-gp56 family major capsid protein n=1 Tax=Lacticaseibacillus mingshuiensis TaxID=2799574 RepID=UPI001951BF37|nr:N4-gp56 family major capsid protein [Lacticaseibacillus mingshuiensis]
MADEVNKLADLIDPAVYAPMLTATVKKAMRFTALATIDNTLSGKPGDTLHFPAYAYMGDAADVAEGEPIPVDKLTTTDASVKIKSIGKGYGFTDQSAESGLEGPLNEGTKQLATALAQKVDSDLIEAAKGSTQTVAFAATVEGVQAATDVFNDEDDATVVAIMNPLDASALRMDAAKHNIGSDVGANALVSGTYADVLGVQIVRTNKVAAGEAFYVKQGALRLIMKKSVTTENERKAQTRTTNVYAYEDYAAYLYDPTKIVYAKGAAAGGEGEA